jgi:thiol-disulfide isomerase/thioredoxin
MASEKQIVTSFDSVEQFTSLLARNPGIVVGAEWCKPCKQIQPLVDAFYAAAPQDAICCLIDADESFNFYAHMKRLKQINGVPVLMCWKRGNVSIAPDDSVTGASRPALDAFFRRCSENLDEVRKR